MLNDIPRSDFPFPILYFKQNIGGNEIVDAINELINDINAAIQSTTSGGYVGAYTVASLPAGAEGDRAFATNGLKIGELTGAGTGVPVYYSLGAWRIYSTDAPVSA